MEPDTTVRTAVVDAALSDTDCTDTDVLAALCDEHVRATREAIRDPTTLLDWHEQLEAVNAL